jgi:hypothetical protein
MLIIPQTSTKVHKDWGYDRCDLLPTRDTTVSFVTIPPLECISQLCMQDTHVPLNLPSLFVLSTVVIS